MAFLAGCGEQTEVATGNWRGANWEVVQHGLAKSHQRNAAQQKIQTLEALLEKQRRTFTWTCAGFVLLLTTAGLCIDKLVRRRTQDKKSFIAQHIQDYDEQILRMLLVKAGYDEIKNKLKKEFGLDDDDFGH